jgi:hypothetical protein
MIKFDYSGQTAKEYMAKLLNDIKAVKEKRMVMVSRLTSWADSDFQYFSDLTFELEGLREQLKSPTLIKTVREENRLVS